MAGGSFKDVYKARLRRDVAKVGKEGLEVAVIHFRHGVSTLAAELEVFRKLGRHPNLTRLLAVTRRDDGAVMSLVTEFAAMGSLDDVLARLEERDERATTDVLLEAAMQTLDGMLQLVEHQIVHRDLALRNLLAFAFDAGDLHGQGGTLPCKQAKRGRPEGGCGVIPTEIFLFFYLFFSQK